MKSDSESKDGISTLTVLSTNTYFALAKIGGALGADERVTKLTFLSRFFAVTRFSLVWHLSIVITIVVVAAIFSEAAFGQSQPTLTESEFWPEVDTHIGIVGLVLYLQRLRIRSKFFLSICRSGQLTRLSLRLLLQD